MVSRATSNLAPQANPIMVDGVTEGMRRPTGRWRGGSAAASASSGYADVGGQEARPTVSPSAASEQGAMPSVSTPVQGEKTKDNKPAASRDAAMGTQEAMPPVIPSDESEQGAMPSDSTQSQAAAGSTQKAKTATELADPKAFFDTVCRCGSEKSFKECSCSTAAFVKLALAQASSEEPQWDLLQVLLEQLQSTAKRRKLSGASSGSAQEAMPPDTGPRKVPMKAPPATKPRPVPTKAAPSSRPPMQEPQASSCASDESERKRRKEEEAERRKREAE